jgi:hypothetical protein
MVEKYYSFTTTTNTLIVYEHIMEFPAVTVCNINPVRWKLLKASQWATDFVAAMVSDDVRYSARLVFGSWFYLPIHEFQNCFH